MTVFADSKSGQYFGTGRVVPLGIYDAAVPVWVVDSDRSLEVVWAGAAPGTVNGAMQINFRLPDTPPAGIAFTLYGNGVAAAPSLIAVAQ